MCKDAVVHSFSTAGTGGFSNRNASVAFYDSAYIDGVITVFMILFGINFNLYFLLRRLEERVEKC
ncbi:MAG: potassium transporter TrkG [[Ruminococcus] torques]